MNNNNIFSLLTEIKKLEKVITNSSTCNNSEQIKIFNLKNYDSTCVIEILDIEELNNELAKRFKENVNFNIFELIRDSYLHVNDFSPIDILLIPENQYFGINFNGSYRCLKMVFNTLFEIVKKFSDNYVRINFDINENKKIILIEFLANY